MRKNKGPLIFGIKKRRTASDVDGIYNQNDSKNTRALKDNDSKM